MTDRHRHIGALRRLGLVAAGGATLVACGATSATPPEAGAVTVQALPADAPVLGAVVVPAELLAVVASPGTGGGPGSGAGAAGGTQTFELPGGPAPGGAGAGGAVPVVVPRPGTAELPGAVPEALERRTFAGGASAAELVEHNRVIVIGDSIAASTSDRYSGETCAALGAAGWLVEIDAEAGRHVEFGVTVVDERLPEAEFDAAVVMLGSNYRGNPAVYEAGLRHIVAALAPRPTVLMTVTEFREDRVEVNTIIRAVAAEYDNVRIVDWAAATAGDSGLLVGDGLHLNPAGRKRFAELITTALGGWTGTGYTGCVASRYTADLS